MIKLKVLDTTLRDGAQTPLIKLTVQRKIEIFKQLLALNFDTIEIGFPAISSLEKQNILDLIRLANKRNQSIQVLSRLLIEEIESNLLLLKKAWHKRLNIFVASSDIHLKYKYNWDRKELLTKLHICFKKFINQKCKFTLCFEDSTRTNIEFLIKIIHMISDYQNIDTLSLADTCGIATPEKYGNLFQDIKNEFKNRFILSAHPHNDLGLATANALSAIKNGATQIEGVLTGLGERAGNLALEEILVILKACPSYKNIAVNTHYKKLYKACIFIRETLGIPISPFKPLLGEKVFTHESGIHQDGMLKNKLTYQAFDPEILGRRINHPLVLGKNCSKKIFVSDQAITSIQTNSNLAN